MSTVYAIDDVAALASSPAEGDKLFIHDVSAGRTKYATVGELMGGAAGVVNTTATQVTLTAASHSGKVVTISSSASTAVVLPQATGTGNRYLLNLRVAATGTAHTISVANATDVISGFAIVMTSATTTDVANIIGSFKTSATSDRVTLNGTTQGGAIGDWVEFVDIKAGFFQVHAQTTSTGTYATPFSAAV
jgi:hypothetical protein